MLTDPPSSPYQVGRFFSKLQVLPGKSALRGRGGETREATSWLRACALVSFSLLCGVIGAACGVIAEPGSAQGPESRSTPASTPATDPGVLVADALSPCAGVSLDARRTYHPKSWTDGDVAFAGGSLTFPVPSEIPVTAGASAKGRAQLTFSSGGGTSTTCVYRGNGDFGSGGVLYVFKKCRLGAERADDDDANEERWARRSASRRRQHRDRGHISSSRPEGRQASSSDRDSPGSPRSRPQ